MGSFGLPLVSAADTPFEASSAAGLNSDVRVVPPGHPTPGGVSASALPATVFAPGAAGGGPSSQGPGVAAGPALSPHPDLLALSPGYFEYLERLFALAADEVPHPLEDWVHDAQHWLATGGTLEGSELSDYMAYVAGRRALSGDSMPPHEWRLMMHLLNMVTPGLVDRDPPAVGVSASGVVSGDPVVARARVFVSSGLPASPGYDEYLKRFSALAAAEPCWRDLLVRREDWY